jgi:hypothetical protein
LGSLATSFCARESAPADPKDYSKSQICHYLRANPAAIKILGVLHRGDFHPCEIKRRLNNALVECYIDVDVGTLYLCRAATGQIGGYRVKSEAEGYARWRTHDLPNYISGPKAISAAENPRRGKTIKFGGKDEA